MKTNVIITICILALSYCVSADEEERIADLMRKFPGHLKPRVDDDYVPKGREVFNPTLNMTVYETLTNNAQPSRYLIAVYDIYAYHDHIKQIADTIALGNGNSGEFQVVVPDFFRGGSPGSWEGGTNVDVRNVVDYYTLQNATSFGIFGFCWGGRISVKAGQEIPEIKGVGLIHPSGVVTADANTLKAPALLLPTSNDPDMNPFAEVAAGQIGLDNIFHFRFTDMRHGFAGAGGNWTDPIIRQRVDQVIYYSINFFNKHL